MPEKITIKDQVIYPGEVKSLDFGVARLPTGTLIDLPIVIARSKIDGPVLLVMGGMHGDEINGVEIIRRFIRAGHHIPQKGSVICVPILNVFGFINFSREDTSGKDINRSFPGSPSGSLASQVAHFLSDSVLPNVDYGIDFHTGGKRINNFPQIRCDLNSKNNDELAKAFGAPFTVNSSYREKSLRKYADKIGKNILVYEAGESLRLRLNAIETGIRGTLRVMRHLNMISEAPEPKKENVILQRSTWLRARRSGMQHLTVRNGSPINKGDVLGIISDPYGQKEIKIKSPQCGYVIAINNNPIVNRGDALVHIGIV